MHRANKHHPPPPEGQSGGVSQTLVFSRGPVHLHLVVPVVGILDFYGGGTFNSGGDEGGSVR